ncbi:MULTISPECIES: 30S ribosomal protein S20 [Anaerotruncus]|jgi:small subunit ribosomal protein S20|uniref:30S ribosomal protein S20 n=1 Tax=Anaerotruncus TaxID=244127 RepID=UPI000E4FF303|nr:MULTISPECIES: 30S ribosomal protein S20 [Anaerotruncus]RGX55140.1 30S ribosomal protein S20 [Anaerotruncus sp. AF02-27]
MPNIKSAKKRVLVAKKKALQNKVVKSNLKTVLKKADAAVAAKAADSADAIKVAIKKVDQAAAKNIMHKNTAAHKKSALMKKLAAASK